MSLLRPASMTLVSIICLKSEAASIMEILLESGAVHIEQTKNFLPAEEQLKPISQEKAKESLGNLLARLKDIADLLKINLGLGKAAMGKIDPLGAVGKMGAAISAVEERLDSIQSKLEHQQGILERKEHFSWFLNLLENSELDYDSVCRLQFTYMIAGFIPQHRFATLKETLNRIPHVIKVGEQFGSNVFVCVVTLVEHKESLEGMLNGANIERVFPAGDGTLNNKIKKEEQLEYEIWQAREEIAKLKADWAEIRKCYKEKLHSWYRNLKINLSVIEVMDNFLQSEYGYYITGWIPRKMIPALNETLEEKVGKEKIEVSIRPAEELLKNGYTRESIPTQFDHPSFMQPFQRLTAFYGYPVYGAIDPTLFAALSLIIMFGMMFGDIGHGAVLILLGLLPIIFRNRNISVRDFGWILIACGISSMIFGFLFGSVFGREDIIRAFWFHPLDNPSFLMMISIIIGISLINLGLIFNIIQCFWNKDFRKLFFGQWGVLGLLFYWVVLTLLWFSLKGGLVRLNWWVAGSLLGIPLVAITFGDVIANCWTKKKKTAIAESVFKPIELIIGLLTNTISFIRIAAFSLTHVGLMLAVFEIARMLGGGNREFRISVIIEGNLLVILLEGLIVFVQCMRLEYYEFFSKFFTGQGRQFSPFKAEY